MLPLTRWGLPTAAQDELLFGGEKPWEPARYGGERALTQLRSSGRGADTDVDPLVSRTGFVELTADEEQRAAILRRFRLQSRQPDEMITFRALQNMRPAQLDFDPRLYQYGGAYIYLVGAALGAAAGVGLITLTSDVGHYLAHPDAFAAFYVVARCVSLAFGAATLVALGLLAARAAGRRAGWLAMLAAATCPVFITMALEAKPHLPSTCMILWATLAALRYGQRRHTRDAIKLGICAGLAAGLVLTGFAAALLWPAIALGERVRRDRRMFGQLLLGGAVAVLVYLLSNPFVIANAFRGSGALTSNLGNSLSMYRVHDPLGGAATVFDLLLEGGGPALMLVGVLGCGLVGIRYGRRALPAGACAAGLLLLLVLLGAGKPAEYGRFLLLPVLALAGGAGVFVAWLTVGAPLRAHLLAALLLLVANLPSTWTYVAAFAADVSAAHEARAAAGRFISRMIPAGDAIGVAGEPAPHWTPPMDFTRRSLVLLPRATPQEQSARAAAASNDPTTAGASGELPRWIVVTLDDERQLASAWWRDEYRLIRRFGSSRADSARICWANKPTFILARRARTP